MSEYYTNIKEVFSYFLRPEKGAFDFKNLKLKK